LPECPELLNGPRFVASSAKIASTRRVSSPAAQKSPQSAAFRRQQRENRLNAPRFVASSAKIASTRHVSSPVA
jgi:hypothetical protein